MSDLREQAERMVRNKLGWFINDAKGLREWRQMGDPYEEKATAAEVRAYELAVRLQVELLAEKEKESK